jgi:hypothetical protein
VLERATPVQRKKARRDKNDEASERFSFEARGVGEK